MLRMPAEWEPHERTVMGWPTADRQAQLWGDLLDGARSAHAVVAAAVARFEPVFVVANPPDAEDAARRCGEGVEVLAARIDDSWLRDTGPVTVRDATGRRRGIRFGFNGWGGSFRPYSHDQVIAATILEHLAIEEVDATDFVLEGGSVVVDGSGRAATTERCLLNPNRNPGASRPDIEARLAELLGAEQVVWLPDGLAEDEGTDGHVDNVCAFVGEARVLLQGCGEHGNPNHEGARANRVRLEEAGIAVVEIESLPYATVAGRTVPVPYLNLYLCNGAAVVPVVDGGDARWLDVIGEELGDRQVVPVPGEVLAFGGGGVHCITQQVIREGRVG